MGHLFDPIPNLEPVTESDLDGVEAEIRVSLKGIPALAHREFSLPTTLRALFMVAQGNLKLADRTGGPGFSFYAPRWLVSDGLALADEAAGDSTPWLEIGSFGDQHWVFMCCDPEDPLYGAVVDCENCTPWSRTVHAEEVYPDLGDFLRELTEPRSGG